MITTYSIAKMELWTGGKLYPSFNPEAEIAYLFTDSRQVRNASETLFFAIKSKRADGHNFIPQLIEQGVRNFVISDESWVAKCANANFIVVKDVVTALQKIAVAHRKQFSYPVIGITGSNGKTVVKEWLYQLLNEDFNIVRNPKSFNSQIGVPISVWRMTAENTLAIFEAGISEPDEMLKLQRIIQPTIGIITNIGEAHSEGFLNIKHKTKEKLRLFSDVETLIYCKDHGDVNQAIGEVNSFSDEKLQTFSWSLHTDADFRVTSVLPQGKNTAITGIFKGEELKFEIPFTDKAAVENAIHCLCAMLVLGIKTSVIAERMAKLAGVAMRLEMKEAVNNCTVINDAYNSDLESIRIAFDFLAQQRRHPRHTIILSDVHQSRRNDPDLYQFVANLLREQQVDRLIGVGKKITRQKKYFEQAGLKELRFFETTDDLLREISGEWFRNETILLKGARSFEFERILKILERKSHRTVLEINLHSLAKNLKEYQSLLKPETKVMAMVKAASYGSGSFEIANVLQFNRVDYLGVAYADEGVDLRRNGIALPIMVMNPEEAAFDQIFSFGLEPDIYSLELLKSFIGAVNEAQAENVKIHIEVETGMNRLGFSQNELQEAISLIQQTPSIKIASVFSHLAAAESVLQNDWTKLQIALFTELSALVLQSFDYPILRHILNTAGVVRHPAAQFDMVRLGIGLYGIDDTQMLAQKLEPVGILKTTISQIKHLKKGETVGYGRIGKITEDTAIATVGIGYADGLHRTLSNGAGKMAVRGQLAPIIGNVCMDMTMLNISAIPNVNEGDEVIVFGNFPKVQQVAEWAGTIAYEVLAGVGPRVKKVYLQE